MAQIIPIFSPRDDPNCVQCLRTTVPPSFSREYFQECKAKDCPESEQWCLPYSIVTDLTEEAPHSQSPAFVTTQGKRSS
jgi:hypothetical protein